MNIHQLASVNPHLHSSQPGFVGAKAMDDTDEFPLLFYSDDYHTLSPHERIGFANMMVEQLREEAAMRTGALPVFPVKPTLSPFCPVSCSENFPASRIDHRLQMRISVFRLPHVCQHQLSNDVRTWDSLASCWNNHYKLAVNLQGVNMLPHELLLKA